MNKETKKHNLKVGLIFALIIGIAVAVAVHVLLGIFLFAAYVVYFVWISPWLDQRKKTRIQNAYRKFLREMPDATDAQREQAVRKYLEKRSLKIAGLLFLGGAAVFLLPTMIATWLSLKVPDILLSILGLVGLAMIITGVLTFVGMLHDPLTPAEAEELAQQEHREKTGK